MLQFKIYQSAHIYMQAERRPDSLHNQVREVLRLMGNDAVHLDDPEEVTCESGLSMETFGRIAFPIFKHMLADRELLWSIERITRAGMELGLDVDPDVYAEVVGHLFVELEEHGLLEPCEDFDSRALSVLRRDSEHAYDYLADLAQMAGLDQEVINRYRSDAEAFREW